MFYLQYLNYESTPHPHQLCLSSPCAVSFITQAGAHHYTGIVWLHTSGGRWQDEPDPRNSLHLPTAHHETPGV